VADFMGGIGCPGGEERRKKKKKEEMIIAGFPILPRGIV